MDIYTLQLCMFTKNQSDLRCTKHDALLAYSRGNMPETSTDSKRQTISLVSDNSQESVIAHQQRLVINSNCTGKYIIGILAGYNRFTSQSLVFAAYQ